MASPQVEAQQSSRQPRGHVWLIPTAVVLTMITFGPSLIRAGWHESWVIALSFYLGSLAGIVWQVFNRCDFVDRFTGLGLVTSVFVLAHVFTTSTGPVSGAAFSFPGVVVGVVLAESWMRQRQRP